MNRFAQMDSNEFLRWFANAAATAYDTVMGEGAFEARSMQDQHDIIMTMAADLLEAMNR